MPKDSIGRLNPFLVPELFHCVLECLVTSLPQRPTPSKLERRTLAALARTCRAFSEPSLNHLWRCLNSLLPLVRCFSDVVDEHRVMIPPTHLEWLIIDRYSPRIQELTLGNEPLSLDFLQQTGLDLPNLRALRLEWPPFYKFSFRPLAFFCPLFSSQIVALEIEVNSVEDPNYLAFLHTHFPLLCPELKSIKLNFPTARDHKSMAIVSHALSRAICSNAQWRHVSLSPRVDHVVLKYLGMLSTLETASLKLASQMSRSDETCFGAQDIPFRNVTDLALTLEDNSLDSVTCILRPYDQAFHSFKVTIYSTAFATEVTTLLTALASPQRIRSLRSLTIHHIPCIVARSSIDMQELSVRRRLSYETLRPLVSLVHLHKLALHLDNPMSMSDEEFVGLVRNWPLLQVLQMTWEHEGHPAPSITLRGLLSLLAACPKLRKIGLTLDARDVPTGAYPHADVCRPSITSPLTVYNSPLRRPDQVAQFLTRHLPRMLGVHLMWSVTLYQPSSHLWSQVNAHMIPPFAQSPPRDVKFEFLRRLWPCLGRSDDGERAAVVRVHQLEVGEDFF